MATANRRTRANRGGAALQNGCVTYAVVVGEALIDLLEEGPVYWPMIGGGPLNVAVGLARLGDRVEFLGAVGRDVLGGRIRAFLADAGVGTGGCVDVDQPTSLAVTSFRGPEPEFHFYGQPPSYGQFAPAHLDPATVAGAATLYCGSIALLCDASRAAARRAWSEPGPLKTLDPNVRASLTRIRPGSLHCGGFAATADLVKLSEPDARALFDADPADAATHLRSLGAAAVVVTRGAAGALLVTGSGQAEIAAPPTDAVDTTGAGDAVMAGLLHGLLITGPPTDREDWQALVGFALTVASLCCERRGGATAMPTLAEVRARLAGEPPSTEL